jgi:hypothetical protein
MDFSDTPAEATFRTEARAWLGKTADPRHGAFETWQTRYPRPRASRGPRDYQRGKAEASVAAITWPREYGGRGGTAIEAGGLHLGRVGVPRAPQPFGDRPRHACRDNDCSRLCLHGSTRAATCGGLVPQSDTDAPPDWRVESAAATLRGSISPISL